MTHLTGPRRKLVKQLADDMMQAIFAYGVTTSEAFEAMHEVQMMFLHRLLEPFEKDCPTCPKGRKRKARL